MEKQTAEQLVKRLDREAAQYGAPEMRLEHAAARAIEQFLKEIRAWRHHDDIAEDESGHLPTIRAHDRACEQAQITDTLGLLGD